jgi:hypothetical protein
MAPRGWHNGSVPSLLVGVGCISIAIALFFWHEGSGYGLLFAWFFGMWGATLVAWGLIAGWYRSAAACIASSVFALAAMVIALACVQFDAWDIAIMCAIASALALIFAVAQACYLLRRPER